MNSDQFAMQIVTQHHFYPPIYVQQAQPIDFTPPMVEAVQENSK